MSDVPAWNMFYAVSVYVQNEGKPNDLFVTVKIANKTKLEWEWSLTLRCKGCAALSAQELQSFQLRQ